MQLEGLLFHVNKKFKSGFITFDFCSVTLISVQSAYSLYLPYKLCGFRRYLNEVLHFLKHHALDSFSFDDCVKGMCLSKWEETNGIVVKCLIHLSFDMGE